jgi:hypothetical protein
MRLSCERFNCWTRLLRSISEYSEELVVLLPTHRVWCRVLLCGDAMPSSESSITVW